MNVYENITILDASLPDDAVGAAIDKLKDLITSSGGEVLKVDSWGRKKLAYEVKKHTRGFYLYMLFRAPSPLVKKLEDYYKVFEPVVKAMVIRLEKKQKEAALSFLTEAAAEAKQDV